uniref:Uncharacterized protein n=1 Tax=Panagrellus redivivus TaxID=6233 RepID=A0A7E4VGV8_PANRE
MNNSQCGRNQEQTDDNEAKRQRDTAMFSTRIECNHEYTHATPEDTYRQDVPPSMQTSLVNVRFFRNKLCN